MGAASCGRMETYAEDVHRVRSELPEVANEIADFTGVGQVVDWFAGRSAEKHVIDLIAMDEFEHDFLVEVERGGRWLAFGVT